MGEMTDIFEKYGDEPTIMDAVELAKSAGGRDWTGNSRTTWVTLGATNHTDKERAENDFYESPEEAITRLLAVEELRPTEGSVVWECACGRGALSRPLQAAGYTTYDTDLVNRGWGASGMDFLKSNRPFPTEMNMTILTNPPFKCFSSDTQCYTKQGWKFYTELTKNDELLSVNPETLQLEWSGINGIVEKDSEEKMYHFKKSHMDLLVTKDHRMFAFRNNVLMKRGGDLIKSQKIRSQMYCPRTGYTWKGFTPKNFILPKIKGFRFAQPIVKEEIKIETRKWVKFFAFWLADGYCRHTKNSQGNYRKTVGIKQLTKNSEQVRAILQDMPFKWKEYIEKPKKGGSEKTNFEIHNEQLWSYLRQFGTSEKKFVPDWIKNCDKEVLELFLDFYLKGDGSRKNGVNTYRTVSKKLIEDVQEILLKTGYLSHITSFKEEKWNNPLFSITENRNSVYNKYFYPSNKKEKLEVSYEGKVWCPILKKNGVFLCRRNGFEIFSGNCSVEFCQHAVDLMADGERTYMLLRLSFLEGQKREKWFNSGTSGLRYVAVFGKRITCNRNGIDCDGKGAVAYAWFCFEKGFKGRPEILWI